MKQSEKVSFVDLSSSNSTDESRIENTPQWFWFLVYLGHFVAVDVILRDKDLDSFSAGLGVFAWSMMCTISCSRNSAISSRTLLKWDRCHPYSFLFHRQPAICYSLLLLTPNLSSFQRGCERQRVRVMMMMRLLLYLPFCSVHCAECSKIVIRIKI